MPIPPNRITVFPLKDDLQWYDPEVVFRPFDDLFGSGVVSSGDLQVVANAPDGQITVKAGRGYVPYSSGGKRLFETSVDLRSDTAEFQRSVGAFGGGNPRIDRVIAKILDASINVGDVLKGGVFDVLPGTPTAGATLVNLSGAAAVPSAALLLGNLLINGATIPTGNIDSTFGTVRARARIGAGNSPSRIFKVNGASLTDRTNFNLIAGSGITINAADNAAADSSDVTIASTLTADLVKIADSGILGSDQSSISFSSIPSTYMGLILRWYGRTSGATTQTQIFLQFNNDTGTNYTGLTSYAEQASTAFTWLAVADNVSSITIGQLAGTGAGSSAIPGSGVAEVIGYSNTLFHKLVTSDWMSLNSGSTLHRGFGGGRWSNTAAINTITLSLGLGDWLTGSRVVLYGIK